MCVVCYIEASRIGYVHSLTRTHIFIAIVMYDGMNGACDVCFSIDVFDWVDPRC